MNLFKVMVILNEQDIAGGTRQVGYCPDFVKADMNNSSTVTMGVPNDIIMGLLEDKLIPVLVIVEREAYNREVAKPYWVDQLIADIEAHLSTDSPPADYQMFEKIISELTKHKNG